MATGRFPVIESAEALEALVLEVGMLPLVDITVKGFSVKACTSPDRWFVDGVQGPWEWREIVAERGKVLYGKFFARRTGFVSPECFADLANWRRSGMDFDERYEDGMIPRPEKQVMQMLREAGPVLSYDIRKALGSKLYEKTAASMQMRTDLTCCRFEYKLTREGVPYGTGRTRFALPEWILGEELVTSRYDVEPEESLRVLMDRVAGMFPEATETEILRLLR